MAPMTAPRLRAWEFPRGGNWIVWCVHCRRYHWHAPENGYRVAHCTDRLRTYAEAAEELRISVRTLRDWLRRRPGPTHV